MGKGDSYTIPSRFFIRGTYTSTLVILDHLKLLHLYDAILTNVASVALKVGQANPYTIPSRFSMTGTYTAILARSLLKLLR